MILHVIDASSEDIKTQIDTTNKVLKDLGVYDIKRIKVFNKKDKVNTIYDLQYSDDDSILISAYNKNDIKLLLKKIEEKLNSDKKYIFKIFNIPYKDISIYYELKNRFEIIYVENKNKYIECVVKIDYDFLKKYDNYIIGDYCEKV